MLVSNTKRTLSMSHSPWDFTVRGYRVADISGWEELFHDGVTASTPQMELSSLKYKDITIGIVCNYFINST